MGGGVPDDAGPWFCRRFLPFSIKFFVFTWFSMHFFNCTLPKSRSLEPLGFLDLVSGERSRGCATPGAVTSPPLHSS